MEYHQVVEVADQFRFRVSKDDRFVDAYQEPVEEPEIKAMRSECRVGRSRKSLGVKGIEDGIDGAELEVFAEQGQSGKVVEIAVIRQQHVAAGSIAPRDLVTPEAGRPSGTAEYAVDLEWK